MTDTGVGEQFACLRVVDDLVDLDRDAAVRLLPEALRLDLTRDRGELALPVRADGCMTLHPAALPGIWPVHVGVHQLDRRIEVTGVESGVSVSQDLLGLRHAPRLRSGL